MLTKIEVGVAAAALVASVVGSGFVSSYVVGQTITQVFHNTDRIIVLEDRDGKLLDTLTEIKIDTAVNREKLKWLKESQ